MEIQNEVIIYSDDSIIIKGNFPTKEKITLVIEPKDTTNSFSDDKINSVVNNLRDYGKWSTYKILKLELKEDESTYK